MQGGVGVLSGFRSTFFISMWLPLQFFGTSSKSKGQKQLAIIQMNLEFLGYLKIAFGVVWQCVKYSC
jgi:hypothetical protein